MLSFIPVVTSKPPFPYFLMSSFILAMASSAAAIWPRISCARPRQYSSLFSPPSPFGSVGRARCVPFLGASPTTDTPEPFIPDKSSSVYTLPFAAVGFFALVLRAASASESSFCGGWPGAPGWVWDDGGAWVDDCCDDDCCEDEEGCCDCAKAAANGQVIASRPQNTL